MILKSKIVVITGGGSGLGRAMAEALTKRGAKVVISGRDSMELESAAAEIGAIAIVADVTKESEVANLAEETVSRFDRIDIWINNAGLWLPKAPVESVDMEKAQELFQVNVFGTIFGSVAALRAMREPKEGTVVNIISASALHPRPLSAVYSASKHAAKGFTDAFREEVRSSHIGVVGVYPGPIKTDFFGDHKPEDFESFMEVSEVAEKILANLEQSEPLEELIIE